MKAPVKTNPFLSLLSPSPLSPSSLSQLLAGARVSDVDNHQRSPIHLAVEGDFHTILSVLLEHAADPDNVDENLNNGLH